MAYSKPYLTPAQQLELIESRGMLVTDRERAISCLKRIGYYRLSAYWYPFRKSELVSDSSGAAVRRVLDNFRPGTSFSLVMDLYVFDKKLRMLVLDAIERVEIALRTDIALLIGRYGPLAHRDPTKLHGNFSRRPAHRGASKTKHQEWLARLDDKFARSNEDFAKHFNLKYPGEDMPIWIAVELWDFGMLSHFFSGMNIRDREAIAHQHAVTSWETFGTWLRCINDVRNICAHHSRLWNRTLAAQPQWPELGRFPLLDHIAGNTHSQTRLYAALAILRTMLSKVNPSSTWATRLVDHIATFPDNSVTGLASAGFPEDWKIQPLWTS